VDVRLCHACFIFVDRSGVQTNPNLSGFVGITTCLRNFVKKNMVKKNDVFMTVDSRVRVLSSPSPVYH